MKATSTPTSMWPPVTSVPPYQSTTTMPTADMSSTKGK